MLFTIQRLPLLEGRFMISAAVSSAPGGRLFHRIEDAARFVVYPDREQARGVVTLDSRWELAGASARGTEAVTR